MVHGVCGSGYRGCGGGGSGSGSDQGSGPDPNARSKDSGKGKGESTDIQDIPGGEMGSGGDEEESV